MAVNAGNTVAFPASTVQTVTCTVQDTATVRSSFRFHVLGTATGAQIAAAAQSLAQLSNAKLLSVSVALPYQAAGGGPISAVYPDSSNKLVMQYKSGLLRFQIQIPAPGDSLFETDQVMGITTAGSDIANADTALRTPGCFQDGTALTGFTRAFRVNRKGGRVTGIRSRE